MSSQKLGFFTWSISTCVSDVAFVIWLYLIEDLVTQSIEIIHFCKSQSVVHYNILDIT